MSYDFIGLEKVVRKFERGEKLTQIEEDILIALYCIYDGGCEGFLYKLSPEKYNKIRIEIDSSECLTGEEKERKVKEKLAKYANSIDYIITESIDASISERRKKDIFENISFAENVSKGLEKLRDFKYI